MTFKKFTFESCFSPLAFPPGEAKPPGCSVEDWTGDASPFLLKLKPPFFAGEGVAEAGGKGLAVGFCCCCFLLKLKFFEGEGVAATGEGRSPSLKVNETGAASAAVVPGGGGTCGERPARLGNLTCFFDTRHRKLHQNCTANLHRHLHRMNLHRHLHRTKLHRNLHRQSASIDAVSR